MEMNNNGNSNNNTPIVLILCRSPNSHIQKINYCIKGIVLGFFLFYASLSALPIFFLPPIFFFFIRSHCSYTQKEKKTIFI